MSDQLASRLAFMRMDSAQRALLHANQAMVGEVIGPSLDLFYEQVVATPETARFFADTGHMQRAKGAQQGHWRHVAEASFDSNYLESARRIGATHARIGLEPRWYVGAYALVLENLLREIARKTPLWKRVLGIFRPRASVELPVALIKAALLDMEISLSIYFEEETAARQGAVTRLDEALAALADGNLSQNLDRMPPAFASLETSFNQAIEKMRGMVAGICAGTERISMGIGEIAEASDNLSRRTQSSAASLEETTASITQMDERLKNTAHAAKETVARADQATLTVEQGRSVADQAVQAMSRVSESAKGIDDVIEGLDKIAFQTRVLAMNAAVEAGRAGEAGRGFAVVADLVSALAMRAEEEAGRARDQLTTTQADIGDAVEAVRKVDGALAGISADVGQVHALLGGMATDNSAQSMAIGEISTAVGAMDRSTQQNAAMVEQTSAATRTLSHEVMALTDLASAFAIDAGAGKASRKPRRSPSDTRGAQALH